MRARERSDAADVVEYALDLAIKTAAYAPNARVLRELAAPLPFMRDKERARRLVGIFDGQKNTVEHIGPTEDYVRLQLLLARTERKYDTAACSNRIDEVHRVHPLDSIMVYRVPSPHDTVSRVGGAYAKLRGSHPACWESTIHDRIDRSRIHGAAAPFRAGVGDVYAGPHHRWAAPDQPPLPYV